MTQIGLARVATTDITEAQLLRETSRRGGPEVYDKTTIGEAIEAISGDGPLIVSVYDTRATGEQGCYALRACKAILTFKSEVYKDAEVICEQAAKLASEKRRREARKAQIRAKVRAERAADDQRWESIRLTMKDAALRHEEEELEREVQKRFEEEKDVIR